jgi:MFS family permease
MGYGESTIAARRRFRAAPVRCQAVNATVLVLGAVVAIAAAVRSTWSPCGQSMLSQLTPVGEASRGYRYGTTAAWFVTGAVVGGAMLGGVMALLAAGFAALDVTAATALGLVAGLAIVSAAVDAGVLGISPPFFLRQVNEDWLGRYRSWVYGSGFGWQVGAGVTTYIMTAAVFLTIAMGALTAGPIAALSLGILFGLVRGLAVLLTARLRSTAELFDLHRRFDALGEPVRRSVIVVQLVVAIVAIGAAFGVIAALVATAVALVPVAALGLRARRTTSAA